LGWVRGRAVDPERLQRLLRQGQCLRTVNPYGLISIQRCYIYAESGLSRQRVASWVAEGPLSISSREILVARYRGAYDLRQKRLQEVSHPTVSHTRFASPQLELIELDEAPWLKVHQRSLSRRTQRMTAMGEPLACAGWEASALVFLYLQAMQGVGRTCFPQVSCVM
jgi:hypothetical protein